MDQSEATTHSPLYQNTDICSNTATDLTISSNTATDLTISSSIMIPTSTQEHRSDLQTVSSINLFDNTEANIDKEKELVIESQPKLDNPDDKSTPFKEANSTDRFNFASFDCGALVVAHNPEAKSVTSILQRNNDQYLLNPCTAKKFLEVELCEEILVDTISLANLEFFSSMFKDIRVLVSNRYPATDWQLLGEFIGQNVRNPQQFIISSPLVWAKYLRIEFLTHYGNEFYCPLTTLKVFGTSMMEDVKSIQEPTKTKSQAKVAETPVATPETTQFHKQDSIFKSIMKRLSSLENNTTNIEKQVTLQISELKEIINNSIEKLDSKYLDMLLFGLEKRMAQYDQIINLKVIELNEKGNVLDSLLVQLDESMRWTHFWNQIHLVVAIISIKALIDQFFVWIRNTNPRRDVSTNTNFERRKRKSLPSIFEPEKIKPS